MPVLVGEGRREGRIGDEMRWGGDIFKVTTRRWRQMCAWDGEKT